MTEVVLPVPKQFEFSADTSPADWIVGSLWPWNRDVGVQVGCFMPSEFSAYARLPNVIEGDSGSREGEFPREKLSRLVSILQMHTARRDSCWYAFWDGYGSWDGHKAPLALSNASALGKWRSLRDAHRRARKDALRLAPTPRVRTEHRGYFLFRASLEDAEGFEIDSSYQSPSFMWPEDRSWCLSTEVDSPSTCLGGSSDLIADVLTTAELDGVSVDLDERLG